MPRPASSSARHSIRSGGPTTIPSRTSSTTCVFQTSTSSAIVAPAVYVQDEVTYRKNECGKLRSDGKVGFNTPTGRIELYSTIFQQFDDDPLPYYDRAAVQPGQHAGALGRVSPTCSRPARAPTPFFHSENRQIPYCARAQSRSASLEVNPKTAQELGIADGQWVRDLEPCLARLQA